MWNPCEGEREALDGAPPEAPPLLEPPPTIRYGCFLASNVAVKRVGLVRRLAADQLHQLVTAVPEIERMGQAPRPRHTPESEMGQAVKF